MLDDGEYSGSVLEQLSEAMAFFKRNTRIGWKKLPDKRVSLPEYPERAVLEVPVNAIVHRDYMVSGSEVHLDIYDNRIEVVSPGGMYDGTGIQELDLPEVPSRRRNPLLADIFSRLGLMERKGSGFEKILTAYRKQVNFADELKPAYTSSAAWFKAVLPNLNYVFQDTPDTGNQKSNQKSDQKSNQKSDRKSSRKSRRKMIELIQNNSHTTIALLADALNLSVSGTKKILAKLREDHIVDHTGSKKGGQWIIVKKD